MENQHQAGVLRAPELRVDDTSADDDDRVPLADAARGLGCTVLDLLGLAAGGTIKLFVALRPYDWVLTATLGAEPRRNASGSTGACQVEMLPKYAEELRNFGAATIRHIPVPGLPDMHFKALSVPQEVGIERVWIARGHVIAGEAPAGQPGPVPTPASKTHRLATRSRDLDPAIDAALGAVMAQSTSAAWDVRADIWNEFQSLARSKAPPAPLLGLDGHSVKYLNGDEVRFLSRKGFMERLKRRLDRAP